MKGYHSTKVTPKAVKKGRLKRQWKRTSKSGEQGWRGGEDEKDWKIEDGGGKESLSSLPMKGHPSLGGSVAIMADMGDAIRVGRSPVGDIQKSE